MLASCSVLLLAVVSAAQERLDARRITSGEFVAERFGPARWLDATHYATLERKAGDGPLELVRYDAATGQSRPIVTAAMLSMSGGAGALQIEDYAFSPDGKSLLVFTDSERVWRQNTRGEYYLLPLDGSAEPRRLGGKLPKSSLMFAKFSPDGTKVAYVAENDLFVEDVATHRVVELTDDGSATIINGTFDWVYEEEFDCRDGFRWSPDSTSIAYWQLDCSGVGTFAMIDNLSDRYARVVPVQYPKAGTTNSSSRIGVISASGGKTVWMQTPGDPRETYLPRMEWHPGGRELMVQWLPRQQNRLQILGCDVATGASRLVHEEHDAAYVDVREDFEWVAGGERFLWTTDAGLDCFGDDTPKAWRQVGTMAWAGSGKPAPGNKMAWTRGFDVMAIAFADLDRDLLYVEASPANATQQYLWSTGMKSGERLTPVDQPGWHDYQVSTDGSLAIHTYSSFDNPPIIDLVRLPSHERVRVLVDNAALRQRYAAVTKGRNEFFQVTTTDGHNCDGWVMYPPDFDPAKKWPVLFHVYGEPWSQTVKDTWALGHHLFHRWMTQQGYVVMSIDTRGTPAPKGRDWRKALYQQIGITSSHDWNQAVQELRAKHAWIDTDRCAIWGWSGGGAMTLNMLFRYPDVFAAGMSVAPVTDITLYDTIYQERYCGDPRQVPEVYRECSPITFAANLKGSLLLVHGTGDDNVHWQNSERLFDKLVEYGKQFEYLAYPNRTHAIREGKGTRQHLYGALANFLMRRVAPGPR